jgi:putative colanic acid biosynthesis acetyltransferase WcaF
MQQQPGARPEDLPVIALGAAPGERASWGRSRFVVYAWGLFEWLLVTNALQVSSRVRVWTLRRFGARIGKGVIYRPRARVRFPWKLTIGDDTWIGEGVWIHNQDSVTIGRDVVISQESMITTGSHAHRVDMALVTAPVIIDDGAWVTARCVVLGGTTIGRSALVTPMSVVSGQVAPGRVVRGNPATDVGARFRERP